MALTPEDGTGLSDADAAVSLSEFNQFLTDRNLTTTATDAAKEAWIREATSDADARYAFPSYPLKETQALSFPRAETYYVNGKLITGLPAKWKEAVMLLAWEARNGSLEPMDDTSRIVRKREKVDVIEEETEYAGTKGSRRFVAADRLLAQVGGQRRGGGMRVVRA
jgi:hypothetical protein